MSRGGYTEEQLAAIERGRDPEAIPALVSTIRSLQHELDRLRLGLDVATRDREELREALLRAQGELRARRDDSG